MREILFRGKRTDNGEWIEGDLKQAFRGNQLSSCGIMKTPTAYCWRVDPETVGQYTGLTDKNGVRIFEGDIVQIKDFTHGCALNYKQPTSKWVVKWYEETARFGIDYMKTLPYDFTESEVIGNIHDNPELLETAAKPADKNIAQSGLAPATENFELMEG